MRFILAVFAVLLLAQTAARSSEETLGSVIYQKPWTDAQYGPILGQARRLTHAWLRSGNARIVDLVDERGDNVPVHFFTESSAAAFLTTVQDGMSYDLTDCAHPARVSSGPNAVGNYCTETTFAAEFHCDLMDSVTPIAPKAVDAAHYSNPKELSVYITSRSCNAYP